MSIQKNLFKGVGTALVTPFNADGSVDYIALDRLIEDQINDGVHFLVVNGTTAENPTLSDEEKYNILHKIIEKNNNRLPIVFGISGNDTLKVAREFEKFNVKGVDGILTASPYYNKPTQEGIYEHYKLLANSTDLPIIVYNVPGRTASNILPETTLRLASDFKNITAVKEASGNLEQIMEIIRQAPDGFHVLSGDDPIAMAVMAMGGHGVISVASNAFGKHFSQMAEFVLQGNLTEAKKLHYVVLPIISNLFAEGNPGGIKECLHEKGICETHLRLPLVNVSETLKETLRKQTREILKA